MDIFAIFGIQRYKVNTYKIYYKKESGYLLSKRLECNLVKVFTKYFWLSGPV